MGIAYCLIRVAPETVSALRDRPRAVAKFIYDDPDILQEAPGLLARIFRKKEETGPVPARRKHDEIDLDKAWHIIHFLLTGSTELAEGPLGLIADESDPLADLNLGLGRPNIIPPAGVAAFAVSAEALTDDDFFARYVPGQIPTDELYLGAIIERGDHDDAKEYALENFHALRAFARQAADNGEAIITYYT